MWINLTSKLFVVAGLLHSVLAQTKENPKAGWGAACVITSSCLTGLLCNDSTSDRYCVCRDGTTTLTETCARNFVVCAKNASSVHCKVIGTKYVVLRHISVHGATGNSLVDSVTEYSPSGNDSGLSLVASVTEYSPTGNGSRLSRVTSDSQNSSGPSNCGDDSECIYSLPDPVSEGPIVVQVILSYYLTHSTGELQMNFSIFNTNAKRNVNITNITSVSAVISVEYQDTETPAAFHVVQSSDFDFPCTVFVFERSCYSQKKKDFAVCKTVSASQTSVTPPMLTTPSVIPTMSSTTPLTSTSPPTAPIHPAPDYENTITATSWQQSQSSETASSSSSTIPTSIEPSGHLPQTTATTMEPSGHLPQTTATTMEPSGHLPPTTATTMEPSGHLPQTTATTIEPSGHLPQTTATTIEPSGHLPQTTATTIEPSGHLPPTTATTMEPSGHLPQTTATTIEPSGHLPQTTATTIEPSGHLPQTTATTMEPSGQVPQTPGTNDPSSWTPATIVEPSGQLSLTPGTNDSSSSNIPTTTATSWQPSPTLETNQSLLWTLSTPNDTGVPNVNMSDYNDPNSRIKKNVQANEGEANETKPSVDRRQQWKMAIEDLWSSTQYLLTLSSWYCSGPSATAVQDFPVGFNITTAAVNISVVQAHWVDEGVVTVEWQIDGALPRVTYSVYVTNVRTSHDCRRPQQAQIEAQQLLCLLPPDSVNNNSCTGSLHRTSFWEYNVIVKATSDRGNFSSELHLLRSKGPNKVHYLNHSLPTDGPGRCGEGRLTSVKKACITWSDFCSSDSWVRSFEVNVMRDKEVLNSITHRSKCNGQEDVCLQNYYVVVDVKPGIDVSVSVQTVNRDGVKGPVQRVTFDVRVPEPQVRSQAEVIRLVHLAESRSRNRTLNIVLNSTEFLHRDVRGLDLVHYFVIAGWKEQSASHLSPRPSYKSYPSWFNRKNGSQIEYRVQLDLANSSGPATLVFGSESCSGLDYSAFCNGPLDPGYFYSVGALLCIEERCKIVVLVHGAHISSEGLGSNEDPPAPVWGKVLMGLGIVVAFALLVVTVYRCSITQKRYLIGSTENATMLNTISRDVPSKLPIKLVDLEEMLAKKLKDDGLLLRQEYENLKALSTEVSHIDCDLEVNRRKNRYADIFAYDHSRVKIRPDEEESDYINANFVPGYNQMYIATQGPLPFTINDFWRMVWEYEVPVIVMLTMPKELGRVKCEQYWPSAVNETRQYGNVSVTSVSVSNLNDHNITIFKLDHSGEPGKELMVSHFLYCKWPDMTADVPPESMLDFITVVRQHVKPKSSSPVVVHCSAGVGRTGTYIGIDYIMKFMEEQPIIAELDIYGFIVRMRQARVNMVQTEDQYILLHRYALYLMTARRRRDEDMNTNSANCSAAPSAASTPSTTTSSTVSVRSQPTVENGLAKYGARHKVTDDVTQDLDKEEPLDINQTTSGAQQKVTDDVTLDVDKEPLSLVQATSGAQQKGADDVTLDVDKEPLSLVQATSGAQQKGADDVTLDVDKEPLNLVQPTSGAQQKVTHDVTLDVDKELLSLVQTTSGAQQKVSDDVILDVDKEPLVQQKVSDNVTVDLDKEGPPSATSGGPEKVAQDFDKEAPPREEELDADGSPDPDTTPTVSASSSTEPLFVP